jgi:uncharacterized protein YajQ (UPF0234 family)
MNCWRWLGAFLFLGAVTALVGPNVPVLAGGKGENKFEWKAFDPDVNKVFYQTMTTTTNQEMTVMNQKVSQDQKQTFYIQWTPLKKDDKGNWVVTQKIIGVKMDIDIGGNKISFDSTAENQPPNPMTDFFKALLNLDIKFTVDPKTMKVEKIEGNQDLIKNLSKTNPQMEPLLKSILSEDALKKMAEPTLFAFPTKAVKAGDSWKKESTLDLGPIGSYKHAYNFKYLGQDKGLEKVEVKLDLDYAPPMEKAKLPFNIENDSKLSGKGGTGVAMFNAKLGRFDSYSMDMNLSGTLNIDIGGMKTKVDLTQTQKATVTTSDTNPVESLKKKKS